MATTWLDLDEDSPFSLANLPYGVVLCDRLPGRRIVVRVGEQVLDLGRLAERGLVPGEEWWATGSLNAFMTSGPGRWREVRARLTDLLVDRGRMDDVATALLPLEETTSVLPFEVGDYVDFYASEHHASNVGRLLRPGQPPLLPNWRHLPIGYHGRSGTVVVSGTDVRRPCGQRLPVGAAADAATPEFGPSARLDFEAEVGWVVGVPSTLGEPVPVDAFAEHVFGVCLVNDWSARDIQAWEYQPLGPFLGKSFATSISAWVVPLDALDAARLPVQSTADGGLLPYLRETEPWGADLALEVRLNGALLSRPPYARMHWSPAQMLAHLTVNGASVRSGDVYASGTVSGPGRDEFGSLIELSDNGATPVSLGVAGTRTFLEDGDEVTLSATAPATDGTRIGLGDVTGRVLPASC